MKGLSVLVAVAVGVFASSANARAQTPAGAPQTADQSRASGVPRVVFFSGQLLNESGEPRSGNLLLTFGLYADQGGGQSMWSEQHLVTLDAKGGYSVVLGERTAGGLAADVFVAGTSRWLGVQVESEPELPRVMLLSVPYALKAADADTLAGKTVTDFVLTERLQDAVKSELKIGGALGTIGGAFGTNVGLSVASTPNALVKYSDASNTQTSSTVYEASGNAGINCPSPNAPLQICTSNATPYAGAVPFISNVSTAYINTAGHQAGGTFAGFEFNLSGDSQNRLAYMGAISESAVTRKSSWVLGTDEGGNRTEKMRITGDGDVVMSSVAAPSGVRALRATGFGYSPNTYRAVQVGGAAGLESVAIGYDPSFNLSGTMAGDGREVIFRRGVQFVTPNAANTGWFLTNLVLKDGFVGIGKTNPTAMLDVAGSVIVDGNIGAKYQDVAEWVESSIPLEAGTVVTVDPRSSNRVQAASRAYDMRVAGAVSRQPGLLLGQASDTKVMVAQSGRVRVKVDARYGAIKVGDLLVTSATPGYAMRSRPIRVAGQTIHRPGTLLGKALEPLSSGKGEILVLLTLQ